MLRLIIVSESDSKIARKFEKNRYLCMGDDCDVRAYRRFFCRPFGRRHASVSKNRMNNR